MSHRAKTTRAGIAVRRKQAVEMLANGAKPGEITGASSSNCGNSCSISRSDAISQITW